MFTKSPPEKYSSFKIKKKEYGVEIKPLNDYKKAIIVFDDILGSSNSTYKDQFFTRHNNSDVYYLSQSYFDLSNGTRRNIGKK